MKQTPEKEKSTNHLHQERIREHIVRSMIFSFQIENITITESAAFEVYEKVKIRLQK